MKFPYGSRDELAIMLRLWLRYIYDYMELPAADRTPTYKYICGYVTSTYGYASEPCTLPGAKVFVIACSLALSFLYTLVERAFVTAVPPCAPPSLARLSLASTDRTASEMVCGFYTRRACSLRVVNPSFSGDSIPSATGLRSGFRVRCSLLLG